MKKIILTIVVFTCFTTLTMAQDALTKEFPKKYMTITTIESVIGGGVGRSVMVITKEDGTQEERNLENLFSITGMNLKNIKSNESDIIKTLKSYTDNGWKIDQVTPLTLSPSDRNS